MAELSVVRELVAELARVAVATVLAGPVSGVGVAADAAITTIAARFPARKRPMYDEAVSRVAGSVQAWADGERLPPGALAEGLSGAAGVMAAYGLNVKGLARVGLDADRASDLVLSLAHGHLAQLSEPAEAVSRRAVRQSYDVLLADPALLPSLDRAFRQEVLDRLESWAPQAAGVPASSVWTELLALPTPTWTAVLHPPSALLRAAYRIVPFEGREAEMADLRIWRDAAEPLGIHLVTGPGGMGKTRILVELCLESRKAGWDAGFLAAASGGRGMSWASDLVRTGRDLLIVIDYVETRQQEIVDLLAAAPVDGVARLRFVLLARAQGTWLESLASTRGPVGELLSGPRFTRARLGPLVPSPADRRRVVGRAADRFAEVLGRTPVIRDQPFTEPDYERVLFLHLAGLDAALGGHGRTATQLLDAALRREQSLWDESVRAAGLNALAGRPMLQAAAAVTLAGLVDTPEGAVALLRGCPLLADQPVAVLDDVAGIFHVLYPGPAWLQGVQPDLLGEHLVGRAVAADPSLLGLLDAAR